MVMSECLVSKQSGYLYSTLCAQISVINFLTLKGEIATLFDFLSSRALTENRDIHYLVHALFNTRIFSKSVFILR